MLQTLIQNFLRQPHQSVSPGARSLSRVSSSGSSSHSLFGVDHEQKKKKEFFWFFWGEGSRRFSTSLMWECGFMKVYPPEILPKLKKFKAWWENLTSPAIEQTAIWLPPCIIAQPNWAHRESIRERQFSEGTVCAFLAFLWLANVLTPNYNGGNSLSVC